MVKVTISILIYGDPHGQFEPLRNVIDTDKPGAVIILGDLGLEQSLEIELADIIEATDLWFIPGNHDTDSASLYRNLFESPLMSKCIHGRVVEIDDLRIAGLGGVFRAQIWHPQDGDGLPKWRSRKEFMQRQPAKIKTAAKETGGLMTKHHSSIWWEDYKALLNKRADILVTHEAPSCHRYGFVEIDNLAKAMGVKTIYHGHHHEDYEAVLPSGIKVHGLALAGIKTVSNSIGRGLREIADDLVEEFDEQLRDKRMDD